MNSEYYYQNGNSKFNNFHEQLIDEYQQQKEKSQEKFLLSSWNINGLRARLKSKHLEQYIKSKNITILSLQETKCDSESFYNLKNEIEKFNFPYIYYNSGEIKGRNGIVIFSKIKAKKTEFDFDSPNHDNNGRFISLEFDNFYLISVYVQCSGENIKFLPQRLDWDQKVEKFLKQKNDKPIIYMGDLNVAHEGIDIYSPFNKNNFPSFTPEEREGFSRLLKMDFIDIWREQNPNQQKFTFWDNRFQMRKRNLGLRIDYFLVNKNYYKYMDKCIIQQQVMGSDHCPIELTVDNECFSENEKQQLKKDIQMEFFIRNFDKNKFEENQINKQKNDDLKRVKKIQKFQYIQTQNELKEVLQTQQDLSQKFVSIEFALEKIQYFSEFREKKGFLQQIKIIQTIFQQSIFLLIKNKFYS